MKMSVPKLLAMGVIGMLVGGIAASAFACGKNKHNPPPHAHQEVQENHPAHLYH